MSGCDLVWLIDADPPSEIGGGRGFYPASARDDPPDVDLLLRRFTAIRDMVLGETGGSAVLTVHTSPRFRSVFFGEPYAVLFRDLAAHGVTLALHPHEDRADGSSLYDDPRHLGAVIAQCMQAAEGAGLRLQAFRSGGFAFHPELPRRLAAHAIRLDLSAAPGLAQPSRRAVWSRDAWRQDFALGDRAAAVASVPIGWDGEGTSLDRNYLFNEKLDLLGLCRIWDMHRRSPTGPRAVNFLTHGFGLVETHWRRQAAAFLRHVRATGGRIVSARSLLPSGSLA